MAIAVIADNPGGTAEQDEAIQKHVLLSLDQRAWRAGGRRVVACGPSSPTRWSPLGSVRCAAAWCVRGARARSETVAPEAQLAGLPVRAVHGGRSRMPPAIPKQ